MKKIIPLISLLISTQFSFAQGMLENIDQNYNYFKFTKNGNTTQMKVFECHKGSCTQLEFNNSAICFNFNPKTEKEIKLFYRSGLNLMHQNLLSNIGELVAYYDPKTLTLGISNTDEFANTINTQIGNQLKMVSTQVKSIIGATNWVSKYQNIRFVGLFKDVLTRPVTIVILSRDSNGNIVETYKEEVPDLSCLNN